MSKLRLNRGLEAFIKSNMGIVGSSTPPAFPNDYSLEFGGVDEYVDCGDSDTFSFGNGTTDSAFSISCWVNANGVASGWDGIVSKWDASATKKEYLFYLKDNKLRILLGDSSSGGTIGYEATGTFTLSSWQHIVATYDGSSVVGGLTLYVNGSPIAVSDISSGSYTAMENSDQPLWIGNGEDGGGALHPFDGLIDEVSIWNGTGLSASQVTDLYNNGLPTNLNSFEVTPEVWYRMGDSGTYYNGIWEIPDQMKIDNFSNYSMSFDGIGDYISMGDVLNFERTDAFSLSIWVKPDGVSSGAYYTLLGKMQNSGDYRGYNMQQQYDDVYCVIESTTSKYITIRAANVLSTNVWKHIVFTYDGTSLNTGMNIYVDGSPATVTRGSAGTLDATIISTAKLTNGRRDGGGDAYGGALDSSSIWDKELSSAEVTAIYNSGTPTDLSTFSKRSFYFDGIDEYIGIGTASLGIISAISVSAWVKTTSTGAYKVIVCEDGTSVVRNWLLFLSSSNKVGFWVWNTDGTENGFYRATANEINDGDWHHIMGTYDGTSDADGLKIIIDGNVESFTAGSTGIRSVSTIEPTIGSLNNGTTWLWDGQIDDVAVFDAVKVVSDVSDGTKPIDCSADTDLVAYWRFDDALYDGSTTAFNVPDSSANSNEGTTVNIDFEDLTYEAPLSPVGYWRMGENAVFNANTEWEIPNYQKKDYFSNLSMDFDGTNSYISFGQDKTDLKPTGAFSLSLWANWDSVSGLRGLWQCGQNRGYMIWSNGTTLQFYIYTSSGWVANTSSVTLATGQWYHLCATWDGSSTTNFYVNAGTPTTSSVSDIDYIGTTDHDIGRYIGNEFSGKLDNVAIFDTALESTKVTAIYNSGVPTDLSSESGLIGYWRMGESANWNNTNWQIPDYSKKNLFSQKSFEFDGIDGTVNCGDLSAYDTGDLSISIWVYKTTSDLDYVFSNSGASSKAGFDIIINNTDVKFARNTRTSDTLINYASIGFSLNTWHHIVGTYEDSTRTVKLYLDGNLEETNTGVAGVNSASIDCQIGSYNNSSSWFTGRVDDPAIWDVVLSADDVTSIYNSGKPNDLTLAGSYHTDRSSNLVGYWTMDDATYNPFPASFWTVPDNSTNSNNGVSSGIDEVELLLESPTNMNSGTSSAVAVEDVINNAPSNIEQGVSVSMDIEDRVTDAPDNENQANSVSMRETAPPDGRSTDTP